MHILEFTVNQQNLTWTNPCRVPVEKTRGWLKARFVTDPEWHGMNLRAIFHHSTMPPVEVPVTSDLVDVPPECILRGYLYVGLVGLDDGGAVQITTKRMARPVVLDPATTTNGNPPENIAPEAWEQALGSIGNLSDLDTTAKNNLVAAINEVLLTGGGSGGGTAGNDGREVELSVVNGYIVWRYVGESAWKNLIALSDLKGDPGRGVKSIAGNPNGSWTITYTDNTTETVSSAAYAALKTTVDKAVLTESMSLTASQQAQVRTNIAAAAAADLASFYKKSETYSQNEINAKISAIPKFSIAPVTALPTSGISATTVYLVKTTSADNLYMEYIFVPTSSAATGPFTDSQGRWEPLGAQTVDLTGYATEAWANLTFQPIGNYVTAQEFEELSETVGSLSAEIDALTKTVEPEEDDIPKVFFGAPLPQTKNDTIMSFRYISKTMDVSGYCKTKAQGNSSLNYPKKNQTVKMYKDAECTEKLEIAFENWGKQSKFCFKANWIDITHARNIVSARLWGDVVKSRSNYAELPEQLRTSPNQGAINGFPIKLYADGIYQGRYTINIPKDAWMANMNDALNVHCILCGENYVSGCFRAAANVDGTDWSDEIHDTVPDAIKTRWNEVISFIMNSTDDDFSANLGNYFDISSLIDYYLFGVVSCGLDAFGKNQLYMTYDGQKWFATMYDMDSTWGLWWNGSSFVSSDYARTEFQDFKDGEGNLLYIRLEKIFYEEIKLRWTELKHSVLNKSNLINRFERFTDICPPWLVEEDFAETTANGAFTGIPSQSTNNIQQIREYIANRLNYADAAISALGNYTDGLVYALTEATTFDGVDDYTDTGIALWEEGEQYTIFADLTSDESNDTFDTAFCCMDENGAKGFEMFIGATGKLVNAGKAIENYAAYQGIIAIPKEIRGKVCVRLSGKTLTDIFYKIGDADREGYTFDNPPEVSMSRKLNLLVGCAWSVSYTPFRFWSGTMHDFRVWNRLLTDDEISGLF